MSRSPSKAGGLTFNPLLTSTDRSRPEPAADARGFVAASADEPPSGESAVGPTKFTFYFTPDQLDRLDAAWSTFRRRTRGSKVRLSKSLFLRVALDRLLDEFDRDPDAVVALLRRHGGGSEQA